MLLHRHIAKKVETFRVEAESYLNPKNLKKIMALWAMLGDLGLLFYLLFGVQVIWNMKAERFLGFMAGYVI